jgi:hypothetical protein
VATTEVLSECLQIILPSIASVVAIIFGIIGTQIKNKYEQKANHETTSKVITDVVKCVEQVFQDSDGETKLNEALLRASTILTEKNIPVSDTELRTLIESAVYGLTEGLTGSDTESTEDTSVEDKNEEEA